MLSNLLQELTLAKDSGRKHIVLDEARLTRRGGTLRTGLMTRGLGYTFLKVARTRSNTTSNSLRISPIFASMFKSSLPMISHLKGLETSMTNQDSWRLPWRSGHLLELQSRSYAASRLLCQVDASMRCMDGIAIWSHSDLLSMSELIWQSPWFRTSAFASNTMARSSMPIVRTTWDALSLHSLQIWRSEYTTRFDMNPTPWISSVKLCWLPSKSTTLSGWRPQDLIPSLAYLGIDQKVLAFHRRRKLATSPTSLNRMRRNTVWNISNLFKRTIRTTGPSPSLIWMNTFYMTERSESPAMIPLIV